MGKKFRQFFILSSLVLLLTGCGAIGDEVSKITCSLKGENEVSLSLKNESIKLSLNTDIDQVDWSKYINIEDSCGATYKKLRIIEGEVDVTKLGTSSVTFGYEKRNGMIVKETFDVEVIDDEAPSILFHEEVDREFYYRNLIGKTEEIKKNQIITTLYNHILKVNDDLDGEIDKHLVDIQLPEDLFTKAGKKSITFVVKDQNGNVATVERSYTFIDDIKPEGEVLYDGIYIVDRSDESLDFRKLIRVSDNVTPPENIKIEYSTIEDILYEVQEVTYTITDESGQSETLVIKLFLIDGDEIIKTINTFYNEKTWTYEYISKGNYDFKQRLISELITETGAMFFDQLPIELSVETNYSNELGGYPLTFKGVIDLTAFGSTKREFTFDVQLAIVDTTYPELNGVEDTIYVEVGSAYDPLSGISAYDEYKGDLTPTITYAFDQEFSSDVLGTYTLTYRVSDGKWETVKEVMVHVVDTTGPEIAPNEDLITDYGYQDQLQLEDILSYFTITDNNPAVTPEVEVYFNDVLFTDSYLLEDLVTHEVKIIATDGVNMSEYIYTITVDDIVAPTFEELVEDEVWEFEYKGSGDYDFRDFVKVVDDFDGVIPLTDHQKVTITYQHEDYNSPDRYNLEQKVTLTVVDAAGNSTSRTYMIRINDTVRPVISGIGNFTLEAGEPVDWLKDLIITDEEMIEPSLEMVNIGGFKNNVLGVYEIIYTITDSGGNMTTETISVTVVDSTRPEFIFDHAKKEYGSDKCRSYEGICSFVFEVYDYEHRDGGIDYLIRFKDGETGKLYVPSTDFTADVPLEGLKEFFLTHIVTPTDIVTENPTFGFYDQTFSPTVEDLFKRQVLRIYSEDEENNRATEFITFEFVDRIRPVLTLNDNVIEKEYSSTFRRYTVEEFMDYFFPSSNIEMYDPITNGVVTYKFKNPSSKPFVDRGYYTVQIYAVDEAGNESTTRDISIKLTPIPHGSSCLDDPGYGPITGPILSIPC